jgi:Cu-Zn family superoxide dismutase
MKAIAVFNGRVSGQVTFEEIGRKIKIQVELSGLKKNALHGFHIHEAGDLSDTCQSMCAHFNPYNKTHGCPGKKERHAGDLGNLETNAKGEVRMIMEDNVIKLSGKACILGRGLVIHADPDDCGFGETKESKITGNSGKRIACAVIGISKENY